MKIPVLILIENTCQNLLIFPRGLLINRRQGVGLEFLKFFKTLVLCVFYHMKFLCVLYHIQNTFEIK